MKMFTLMMAVCLCFCHVRADLVKCENPEFSATSVSNPPDLVDLEGTWYVYATSKHMMHNVLRCGVCTLWEKGYDHELQCIFLSTQRVRGGYNHYHKYVTGKLTKSDGHYSLKPSPFNVGGEFIISSWSDRDAPITVTLCDRQEHDNHIFRTEIEIKLTRKGPVTRDAGDTMVQRTRSCFDVVFDPQMPYGLQTVQDTCGVKRPTGDIPKKDCIDEGWVKINDHKYLKLMPMKKTWEAADANCKFVGGSLSVLENDDEAKAVLINAGSCRDAWIGHRREKIVKGGSDLEDGELQNINDLDVDNAGGKEGAAESKPTYECGSVDYSTVTVKWAVNDCDKELAYICERDSCPQL